MKINRLTSTRLRQLMLAPACALLVIPAAFAQATNASPTTPEARALAKYDLNKNGRLDPDEQATMATEEAKLANTPVEARSAADRDVVQLSAFTVEGAEDKGYYASNVMSGTRLNSRIEDLAASITVVTKQQLMDTAAVDINDIFLYEANTEGTGQFTDFTIDRGNVVDNVAGNPAGANRVRGLSAANIARGNFASGATPLDSYNIDSVEISRGPNSSIFGVGDASGTVNVVQGRANLNREISTFSAQVDSYEGFRFTADLNRPILRGNASGGMKLAGRISAVYEEKGYVRQPSMDRTNRLTGALTFRPFKDTVLTASYESYHNYNQRPNATPPRDTVSFWRAQGSPTWLPLTQQMRRNGVLSGPFTDGTLPLGLNSHGTSMVRIQHFVESDGTTALLTRGNLPNNANIRFIMSGTDIQRNQFNGQPVALYNMPVVKDRSIYDYENVNLISANYGYQKTDTYNVGLEHTFVRSGRNMLALQAAWFREDTDVMSRNFIGQSDGAPSTLQIDVNETLLDGSPNPFFLRPFVGGNEPQVFRRPELNDNYRATIAYQLDLRRERNLLRFLGMHSLAAYGEFREILRSPSGLRFRDQVVSVGAPYIPVGTTNIPSRNDAHLFPHYYVGDANGQNVDHGSVRPNPNNGMFTARVYDVATSSYTNLPVDIQEIYFSQGMVKRQIATQGLNWQMFLWKDRFIPLLGWRKDHNYNIDGFGRPINPATALLDTSRLYQYGTNKRWTQGSTKQKGAVLKPFLGWSRLDAAANGGNIIADVIRGTAFHYNESDSFQPSDTQYTVFGDALPNPSGTGKDYGISFNNIFGSKFSMRLSKYETFQLNARGTIGVISTRANRMDFGSDGFNLQRQSTIWFQTINPTWSVDQVSQAVATTMGMTQAEISNISGKPINDTNSALSKGYELEMSYNPSRHWTLKVTGAQQQAIDSDLSPNLQSYLEQRLPIWTSVRIPTALLPDGTQLPNAGQRWWDVRTNDLPSSFYTGNVLAPLKLAITTQGKPKPQTRKYSASFITTYRLAGLFSENKWLRSVGVGGSARYASKGAIGFLGGEPDTDGVVRSLDGSKPVFDKATIKADLWASYDFKFYDSKIKGRLQLNIRDVFENGHLQRIAINPDGTPWNYRIIDPRRFVLTATFDL